MPSHRAVAKPPERWLGRSVLVALGLLAWHGSFEELAFLNGRKETVIVEAPPPNGGSILTPLLLIAAVGGAIFEIRRRIMVSRQLKRPYTLKNPAGGDVIQDPYRFLTQVITFLQDELVRPLDEQLPGRPFEYDCHSFPFVPMVLVIGNHSSGKSTFINRLMGLQLQETGVAPTDDGFTVLERHASVDEMEDGPTLLGCTDNRPFRELQRFGQAFVGRFRRKRVVVGTGAVKEEDCYLPEGLQVVDTPGMIDMPGNSMVVGGRGYNFMEVVRWFAKRADLILILFDPDKPGTTGEALDVLTKSLAGLDHKFLIVLNKVDTLDNSVDFARAYGTLGWALSKVIPRKDLPTIYNMYNAGFGSGRASQATGKDLDHKLPLEAFMAKRDEVIAEVLRAKVRHWDNVVTSFEETLRQLEMVLTISLALHMKVLKRKVIVWTSGIATAIFLPVFITLLVMYARWTPTVEEKKTVMSVVMSIFQPPEVEPVRKWYTAPWPYELIPWEAMLGMTLFYTGLCVGFAFVLRELCRQYERLVVTEVDVTFEECYAQFFIHTDGEDHKWRWAAVKPKIASMALCGTCARLPMTPHWKIEQIRECLDKDCWYLRQLAKLLRGSEPGANFKKMRSDGAAARAFASPQGAEKGA
mmetsp:Transcript_10130/g.22797  ORF Transcript_10130/g.22797 Transcript_10130/m.22797 type:complete len:639 (-) Transcript_10130:50-1966(-)